jgi:hypothetical protein
MYQSDKVKSLTTHYITPNLMSDKKTNKYVVSFTYEPFSTSQMYFRLNMMDGVTLPLSGQICFKKDRKKSRWKVFDLSPDELKLHFNNIKNIKDIDVNNDKSIIKAIHF